MTDFGRASATVLSVLLLATAACARHPRADAAAALDATAISGPSLLTHLDLGVTTSKLGQIGGKAAAPETPRTEPSLRTFTFGQGDLDGVLARRFTLTGADLYRLSCQSCHGPDGTGAPPEVNSLIGPVQGTSPALITDRLKQTGAPVDPAFIAQLAAEARTVLRQRLHDGGRQMQPFAYLSPAETAALIGYLDALAGVPDAGPQPPPVQASAARVGDLLVRGTCHVCHDATGPNGGRGGMGMMAMVNGTPPSLVDLSRQDSVMELVQKVHDGTPGSIGRRMGMMGSGPSRMPLYPYLTSTEVTAAGLYLHAFPPQP